MYLYISLMKTIAFGREVFPVGEERNSFVLSASSSMANFLVMSYQFDPGIMNIQQGPEGSLQRNMMVDDDPPLDHARFALVFDVPPPPDLQREAVLAVVRRVLRDDHDANTT